MWIDLRITSVASYLKTTSYILGSRGSDLGSRIPSLASRISALASRISDLGSQIPNLGSRISNLPSRITCRYRIILAFRGFSQASQVARPYGLLHSRSYQNSSSRQEYNRSRPGELSAHSDRPQPGRQVVGSGQKNLVSRTQTSQRQVNA